MIRDDTRQTIKFVIWVIGIIIAIYIASVAIFYGAGSQSRNNDREITKLANQKTPIRNIDTYYHHSLLVSFCFLPILDCDIAISIFFRQHKGIYIVI